MRMKPASPAFRALAVLSLLASSSFAAAGISELPADFILGSQAPFLSRAGDQYGYYDPRLEGSFGTSESIPLAPLGIPSEVEEQFMLAAPHSLAIHGQARVAVTRDNRQVLMLHTTPLNSGQHMVVHFAPGVKPQSYPLAARNLVAGVDAIVKAGPDGVEDVIRRMEDGAGRPEESNPPVVVPPSRGDKTLLEIPVQQLGLREDFAEWLEDHGVEHLGTITLYTEKAFLEEMELNGESEDAKEQKAEIYAMLSNFGFRFRDPAARIPDDTPIYLFPWSQRLFEKYGIKSMGDINNNSVFLQMFRQDLLSLGDYPLLAPASRR